MIDRLIVATLTMALLSGCTSHSRQSATLPTSQPTTAPAAAENIVTATDFDRLWEASANVARDRMFTIDRSDYRGGVLTTEPLVSAQFFEPWRRDAITSDAVAESSLATIRRTIRFEFARNDNGTFTVVPRVLVERYAATERRITAAMLYRAAFKKTTATGTRESDRGIELPARYWYKVGNDPVLEKDLSESIRRRV
ncbi:MAG: hypothetical protein WBD40_19170 [Tepidisphaeraceae bacterium]